MDTTPPSEGGDAGSTPAGGTRIPSPEVQLDARPTVTREDQVRVLVGERSSVIPNARGPVAGRGSYPRTAWFDTRTRDQPATRPDPASVTTVVERPAKPLASGSTPEEVS